MCVFVSIYMYSFQVQKFILYVYDPLVSEENTNTDMEGEAYQPTS